jgi:23S rRNA pseudouridine2605 synthase
VARALELPAAGVVRRYRARARGRVTQERLDKLKNGITVEGVHYGSIEARLDKAKEGPQGANLWLTVTLSEGKNREVRRVLEALGLKVNRLMRLAYGPFALGTLLPGEIEEVGPRVIREQLAAHIEPAHLPKGDRPLFKKLATPTPGRRQRAVPDAEGGARRAGRGPPQAPRGQTKPGILDGRPEGEGGKKVYKKGWAKAKPPKARPPKAGPPKRAGSPPAAGPPAGPRGPKPSASPLRNSGARRPGPRPGGGPRRRG